MYLAFVDPRILGVIVEAKSQPDVHACESRECLVTSRSTGEQIVRQCIIFYLAAFASLWIVAVVTTYTQLHRHGKPFSYDSMVFAGGINRFADFATFNPITERFSVGAIQVLPYPPPMDCLYVAFTRNFHKPLHKFLLFLGLIFSVSGLGVAFILYRSYANRLLLALAAMLTVAVGYPFLFLMERANMEGVVFAIVAAALLAFFMRHHFLSGSLIAVATSMKIFPFLLFALLLARRRYWELLWSVSLIIPLEFASLWIIGPTVSAASAALKAGLQVMSNDYFLGYPIFSIGYDHSLFALGKQILHVKLRDEVLHKQILAVAPWYSGLVALGLLALYWLRIRKLPILNQAMLLVILAVTLPYMSFEYTLTAIFLVWAMFVFYLSRDVTEGRERISLPAALSVLGILAFLFAPASYISGRTMIYGGQVQTLALVSLTVIILALPMRCAEFDSPPQEPCKPSNV